MVEEEEEEHFRLFVSNVPDYAIFLLDVDGRVATWNAGAQRIKGYRAEDILGRYYGLLYTPEARREGEPQRHLAEAAASGHEQYEGWRMRADGSRFYADVVISALFDPDGHLAGYGKVVRDVTERRTVAEELAHRSTHDALTGLPNRALLLDRLDHALGRLQRHPARVGLLFVDLDRFKIVNDKLGHEAGDHLLVAVAERLRGSVRPDDTVARLGGDEFVVLCEDLTNPLSAVQVAQRIVTAFTPPVRLGREAIAISASIGVASTADAGCDPDSLLRDADAAMYNAKREVRGPLVRVQVFDPAARAEMAHRVEMEGALRHALDSSELALAYQPVVDLREGRVITYEALLRWTRDDGRVVGPAEFVPIAERTDLIRPLGAWVLERACAQAAAWRQRHVDNGAAALTPGVAINVSARQLDAELVRSLPRTLDRSGLDPKAVCLEVTETSVMADVSTAVNVLGRLRELGVSVAIDDFGTGYSSLSYLQRLPVDTVKIDHSFVAGLGVRSADSAIVAATVGMAKALGLSVIAEGVETALQCQELRKLGCDSAQGYYFGRPQTAESVPLPGAVTACGNLDLRNATTRSSPAHVPWA